MSSSLAERAEEEASPRSSPLTVRNVAISAGVALVLHLPALIRRKDLNSDEATIAVIARMMRHGASLYSSAVDRKPPVAFVLYRLIEPAFGTWSLTAARWIALAGIVAAAWVLAMEAFRRWPEVSGLAVALVMIAAFSMLPAEDSRAFSFEGIATLPAVAAFVLGARRRTLLAALALGLAALCKQTLLLGALPLAVQCLQLPLSWGRRFVRLAIAGVVTAGVVLAGLAPFGLRDAFHWYLGINDNYLGGTTVTAVAKVAGSQIGEFVSFTLWLLILIVGAWWHRARRIPLDALVWAIAGAIGASIGFRFVFHYFDPMLPALVFLAAPALRRHELFSGWWRRTSAVLLAGALVFSMVTVLTPTSFHHLPNVDRVVAAIDERTQPGDRIFVWGQAPEIYWLSDRDPATRYPHVGFITGITPKRPDVPAYVLSVPGAADTLLEDLERDPPVMIIDAAIKSVRGGDRYPLNGSSTVARSPIADFVAANYCETDVIDGMRLLERCTD